VRPRHEDPRVVLREHYCPGCAMCLGVDVLAAESRDPDAPRLLAAATV
jgi:hypothetical protein